MPHPLIWNGPTPAEYGQNFHSKKNRAFRRKRDRRRRAALGGKKPKALN